MESSSSGQRFTLWGYERAFTMAEIQPKITLVMRP